MITPSVLRPRPMSDMLDLTFALYRRSFFRLALISALSQIPLGLLQAWYQPALNARLVALTALGDQASPSAAQLMRALQGLIVIGGFFFVSVLVTAITQAALTDAGQRALAYEPPDVARAYLLGWRRSLAVLAAATVTFALQVMAASGGVLAWACWLVGVEATLPPLARVLFFGGGAVLLGLALASLACQVRLQLMLPTIVVEHASCVRTMARSWRLTRHAFWRAAGFLCAVSLCYYCCILIPQNLASYLQQQQAVALVVRYSSLILATPIISLAYTVYYYDARVRNEGYDLDVRIQQRLIE